MKVLSIIRSISIIIASLGTLITVIFSINAWRREQVGKRKLELVPLLLLVYNTFIFAFFI